ncbi:MAG: bifunctional phosphopantothenoylcysteine decarboxylase/phosphopantothenate--cysteine ligase CoaBC [Melioribacteraceae bacterium]|nr:MAG: bifunctional phosphopantothenoylcysteine decarboxylase/phosphopantothenate--cysteine ligase CoaBC [Melioribacteraceae bacterium]
MSNYKILFKITGSIAAYKSAYLISKLVQSGYEVQTVVTNSALEFIGKATLEGLTGKPVITDTFQSGGMMSHINLVKWADLTILAPATANTINKLAAGIGDNILTSLFLAHDFTTPYLIAPAMNMWMYDHPATKSSLEKLQSWGVEILPTGEGYLACGDMGKGKLLEPDLIFNRIEEILKDKKKPENKLSILITAGGTREDIDGVRFLTNLSTGKTAAAIADHFINEGHSVTYLHAPDVILPKGNCDKLIFTSFKSLDDAVQKELKSKKYNVVIHNAAVSDYSVESVVVADKKYAVPFSEKLPSSEENISLNLKRNEKIVNKIKSYSKDILLTAFKLTANQTEERKLEQVNKLFADSNADFVVQNDISDRENGNVQQMFSIYGKQKLAEVKTVNELAIELEKLFSNVIPA